MIRAFRRFSRELSMPGGQGRARRLKNRLAVPAAAMAAVLAIASPAAAGSMKELRVSKDNRGFLTQMQVGGPSKSGMRMLGGSGHGMRDHRGGFAHGHAPGKPKIIKLGDHGKPGDKRPGGGKGINVIRNENNITIENNINIDTQATASAASRSGVRYISGGSVNRRDDRRGFREIAGGGHRHKARRGDTITTDNSVNTSVGFSNSGLIVLNITNGSSGMSEMAGGGMGTSQIADCAYGTYCTIHLGGPKIITFNDVADFEADAMVDEDLTEAELIERYGSK